MGLWSQRIQTKTSEIRKYLADQCAHQQVFNYRCCEINVVSWRTLWRSLSPQPPLLGTSVAEALTLGGHFPGLCTIRQPLSTPHTSREQDTIRTPESPHPTNHFSRSHCKRQKDLPTSIPLSSNHKHKMAQNGL